MWFLTFLKPIFKSLSRKSPTYTYPYAPVPKDQLVRGHIEIDIAACIFCTICVRRCPAGALAMDKKLREFEIAHFQCIVCGACVEACPKKCLYMRPELAEPSAVITKEKITEPPMAEGGAISDA